MHRTYREGVPVGLCFSIDREGDVPLKQVAQVIISIAKTTPNKIPK